ncbi:MAG TPA: hypothetical protein VK463_12030 [Desulfomonilaceae bacterium]|nr:hypothetical protein [Desulfomonilaceae bacterium]
MAVRYQQFLGSNPGSIVELVDDTMSPYLVRTEQGFEFYISAEDLRNYYREEGSDIPARWNHFVTDRELKIVDSRKMTAVMDVIHSVERVFQDFEKSREFVRDAAGMIEVASRPELKQLRLQLETAGWAMQEISDETLARLMDTPSEILRLLMSNACAVGEFVSLPTGAGGTGQSERGTAARKKGVVQKHGEESKDVKGFRSRMKNVEISTDKDLLKITVDLSKEFGPSKSGKTIIVASTEGNKSVPGRVEKVGLNIYKKEDQKPAKGRRKSFKNVEMDVKDDMLTLAVDLSKEFGPSKSGKTIIVASTEGNQLVYNRGEKIGLNVYRKID